MFGNISGNKSSNSEKYWSKFDREKFIFYYFSVNSFMFISMKGLVKIWSRKFYSWLFFCQLRGYPLKRFNKYKLKFKSKSWITLGLQKSISVKNKLILHFMKKSKEAYYNQYFETNQNDIKNTWKGIKSLISFKNWILLWTLRW